MEEIFNPEPYQWGLRGDKYLWREMKMKLLDVPSNVQEFENQIREQYKQLSGVEMSSGEDVYIDRYNTGGMSGGVVCSEHWEGNLMPLLKKRFTDMVNRKTLRDHNTFKIRHKFSDQQIPHDTEVLIVGTFNPNVDENSANYFYSRPRNHLWKLVPTAYSENSLKGTSIEEKLNFVSKYKISFIDLIQEVVVEEVANYDDGYLDDKVSVWCEVVLEIEELPNLKKVCFTRKTFSDIPNMKQKVLAIEKICNRKGIKFQCLKTPARGYSVAKQEEWNLFFRS